MSSLLIDRFQAHSGPTRLSDVNGGLWQSAVAQAKTLKVSKQPLAVIGAFRGCSDRKNF